VAPAGPGSDSEAPDSRKEEVLRLLKSGKQHLRSGNNAGACEQFQKALAVAQEIGDVVEEKKAARGVGTYLSTSLQTHQQTLRTTPALQPSPIL